VDELRSDGPGSYHWFHDVRVDETDFDELDHVGNAAIARMLDDARTAWCRSLDGRQPGRNLIVRFLSISYEREIRRGVRLRCGVRALHRTRRGFVVDQVLFDAERDVVVTRAEAVHLCFDVASRSVVPVWPALLAGVERRQGAPLVEDPPPDPAAAPS
jgi:acyl-CoA thioesterase FadM